MPTNAPTTTTIALAAIAGLVLSLPLPAGLPTLTSHAAAQASPQPSQAEPYVVVVTAESGVPLRAGDSTLFYPVASVKAGDMLLVDGEASGWLRVAYPQGLEVFVKAEDASEPDAANTTRLNKPSRLLAPNLNAGARASFMQALSADLPSGTNLKVTRIIRSESNAVTHYAVAAPSEARAFISREAVRRATADEQAQFQARQVVISQGPATAAGAEPAPAPSTTAAGAAGPASDGGVREITGASAPAATTSTTTTATTTDPTTRVTTIQTVTTTTTPAAASTPSSTPSALGVIGSASQQATEIPMTVPVAGQGQGVVTQVPAEPAGQPASEQPASSQPAGTVSVTSTVTTTTTAPTLTFTQSIDQLAATFNRVSKQPIMTAELEPAIAHFEAFKTTLSGSERDRRIAAALQSYIDALRLRMDLRESMKTAQANAQSGQLIGTPLGQRVVELERQRVYNVIGRLVRSTVYDGNRVPLLYRVMSPEPGSARTLGYLLPDEKFDLPNKLEQVVGIIGELRPDASLRTNLITPRRVDVVSLDPIVISPDIPGVVLTPAQRQQQAPAPQAPAQRAPAQPVPTTLPGGVQEVPAEVPAGEEPK
jgi:hypothetical protein